MGFKRTIDMPKLEKALLENDFLCELKKELIDKGNALLTFRNKEATIYYKGNNLCSIRSSKVCDEYEPDVYSRFLPLSRSESLVKKNSLRYTEKEWKNKFNINQCFIEVIPEIKDNIEKDASPEALQVSSLYKFSPLVSPNNEIVLLDIEAEFEGITVRKGTKTLIDRIDVVLYHKVDKRLIFLEVKRLDDKRLEDKNGSHAEILNQLQEYSDVLKDKSYIDNFNKQYNEVIKYYNQLNPNFNLQQIEKDPLLGLLIVEFNSPDKKHVSDIKKAIEDNGYRVCSIGNTESVKKETLKKWYDIIK